MSPHQAPSPRVMAERAAQFLALVEATGQPYQDVANALAMTKSALSHKVAGRRSVSDADLAALRLHLAGLNPSPYTVAVMGDGALEDMKVEAVSMAAALRAAAVVVDGRAIPDTPSLESDTPG